MSRSGAACPGSDGGIGHEAEPVTKCRADDAANLEAPRRAEAQAGVSGRRRRPIELWIEGIAAAVFEHGRYRAQVAIVDHPSATNAGKV